MFKFIKKFLNDYQDAITEMNNQGYYIYYHSHGSVTHYVSPRLNTHINTTDDKLSTVSKNNTNP
jgi:hypothetical protein